MKRLLHYMGSMLRYYADAAPFTAITLLEYATILRCYGLLRYDVDATIRDVSRYAPR